MYVDPEGKYQALEKYGNDLTELARSGKLDPVIGRDDEIRRCIQILSRRTKNNPVIIGEPGVGKTAIAEGYVACVFSFQIQRLIFHHCSFQKHKKHVPWIFICVNCLFSISGWNL